MKTFAIAVLVAFAIILAASVVCIFWALSSAPACRCDKPECGGGCCK